MKTPISRFLSEQFPLEVDNKNDGQSVEAHVAMAALTDDVGEDALAITECRVLSEQAGTTDGAVAEIHQSPFMRHGVVLSPGCVVIVDLPFRRPHPQVQEQIRQTLGRNQRPAQAHEYDVVRFACAQ